MGAKRRWRNAQPTQAQLAARRMAITRPPRAGLIHRHTFDWEAAYEEQRRAAEADPSNSFVHWNYGEFFMDVGCWDEAINEADRALELDPLSLYINQSVGHVFCFTNEPDRAIDLVQMVLEMDPDFSGAHLVLGAAYLLKSKYEEAMAEFQREIEGPSSVEPTAQTYTAIVCALTGRKDECLQIRDDLLELPGLSGVQRDAE